MAKKILILNGAARKNGSTAKLVRSFTEGARSAGHSVEEFYLDGMDIHSCKGCLHAGRDAHSPCSQKDDMDQIYSVFADCDVVVFASPLYFREATSQVDVLARIFGDCRESPIPRCLHRGIGHLDNYRNAENSGRPFVCGAGMPGLR